MPSITILDSLKRTSKIREDARNLYLLYEGKNTEPEFINALIYKSDIVNKRDAHFIDLAKTGNDEGRTSPYQLIQIAKDFKKNHKDFRNSYDKIIVFFDLDVFSNNQKEINKLLLAKDNDIILCYTNPAIELFLLLTLKQSYEKYIEPHKKEILDNEYYKDTKERYVYHLAKEVLKLDTKSKSNKLSLLAKDFKNAYFQEKLINHHLNKAATQLTSNIGYVFNKITNNKYDEIKYNQ